MDAGMQGDFNDNAKKKPGEMLRGLLGNAASDDYNEGIREHRAEVKVDGFFQQAGEMSAMAARQLMMQVQMLDQQMQMQGATDEQREAEFVHQRAHGLEMPALKMMPDEDTDAVQLTNENVVQLRGYVRLHAIARALDMAVNVTGLGGSASSVQVQLDICKSYEQGRQANPEYYPELPAQQGAAPAEEAPQQEQPHAPIKRKRHGGFDI